MTTGTLLSEAHKTAFDRDGYFIAEAFLSPDEVESIRREITAIVDRYPDIPEELVQIEPAVRRGAVTPESKELGVRKLFRMTRHSELFHALALHPGMVGIAVELIGPDVSLFQSMLLMKPPRFGGQKVWHQDNAYFRLEPNNVFGFWIALDDADVENGCMHVIPGSHREGIGEHGGVADDYGSVFGAHGGRRGGLCHEDRGRPRLPRRDLPLHAAEYERPAPKGAPVPLRFHALPVFERQSVQVH